MMQEYATVHEKRWRIGGIFIYPRSGENTGKIGIQIARNCFLWRVPIRLGVVNNRSSR